MVRRFDIVMVTDARLPGGTSASVAEEVRAQAAAGFRTALLQVDSPLVRRQRPLAPRLRACIERGELELLLGDEPIETDLVMVRHPTVARSIDPATAPTIRTTNRLLVVNQAPGTPGGPEATDDQGLRYAPSEVDAHLAAWLDGPVDWVPIGPLVRADLAAVAPDLEQQPEDWVNVIDVAAWRQLRQGAMHRVPVIGRHSRNDPMKWPATREEVLRVYPAREDLEVHVLGGEPRLRELFGDELPDNWLVHPFGSMAPERFLAGIDIYVYYHHPALVEAFGRTIMEALASGAPTILPPHFRVLFEDAAVYAEPDEVLGHVRELHRDRAGYREAAERASAFVAERFGHATHVARVAELATPTGERRRAPAPDAPPRPDVSPVPVDATSPSPDDAASRSGDAASSGAATSPSEVGSDVAASGAPSTRRRVLFVSSNGAGVGHLMRLMALARRAPDDIEPLFLTFSQAAKVVDDAGYLVEYLASRAISGSTAAQWHPMLRERVNELIDRYGIRAMVFDGTWPYQGFLDAATDQPGVGLVWSRRAMWKPGISNPVLDLETDRFDLILEPGEFAADEDRGPTREHRQEAVRVGPVSYLGLDEMLEPAAAREALDLDPDRPTALVNLGAGNINDVSSLLGMVVDRLAAESQLQVCVVHSIIADRAATLPENVRPISVYPLARYLRAFDLAFAASGYNSYHELLLAAVPTAFVPNLQTATDNQAARSRFAHRVGVGIDLPDPTEAAVDEAVRTLLDPAKRRRMHERAVARRLDNGAGPAMDAIVDLIDAGVGQRPPPLALRTGGKVPSATRGVSRRDTARGPAARDDAAARRDPATQPGRGARGADTPPELHTPASGAAGEPSRGATGADTPPELHTPAADTPNAPAADTPNAPASGAAGEPSRGARGADTPPELHTPASGAAGEPSRGAEGADTPPELHTPALSDPRSVVRIARRIVGRLLRRARPVVLQVVADGRVKRLLARGFYALPAPVRLRVRRAARRLQRSRAESPAPGVIGATVLPVPPGAILTDVDAGSLPPLAIVMPRTTDGAVHAAVIDHVAQLQVATRGFAPLFITSNVDFRPLRRYGYLFEYFPPRDRWGRTLATDRWEEARRRRLTSILQAFGISRAVVLPEPDDESIDGLRAIVSSIVASLTDARV